jgi:hypothetical protein
VCSITGLRAEDAPEPGAGLTLPSIPKVPVPGQLPASGSVQQRRFQQEVC